MSDAGKVWVVDPTDGTTRQVAAEEAQQGFQAGKLLLPKDGTVHMTGPDGSVQSGPTAGVSQLLSKGWRLSNQDEVLKSKADNQQTQAFLEGGLSELTFGMSDVAAQQMGVEGLKERRETTGGMMGRGLGMGAGILLAGPAEAAASAAEKSIGMQAAEAALFPMRKLMAAGDAVEQAAGKALASHVENQAAARAAASGLGRAVEGAAFGAGGALSEEAMGNPNANAQSYLAAAGAGALLGGVVGGAAGATLRGLGDSMSASAYRAGREAQGKSVGARYYSPDEFKTAMEAANGQAFSDEASKGVKGWLYDLYKKGASALSGGEGGDIDIVNSAYGQKVQREGEKYFDAAGRDLRDVMGVMADVQEKGGKEAYGAPRRKVLDELMPEGATGSVVASAGRAFDNVRAQLDSIEGNAEAMGYAPSVVDRFRKAVDASEERLLKKAGVPIEYTERRAVQVPRPSGEVLDAEVHYPGELPPERRLGDGGPPKLPPGSAPKYVGPDTYDYVEEVTQKRRGLKDLGEGAWDIPHEFAGDVYEEALRLKRMFDKPGMFGMDVPDSVARDLRDAFRDIRTGLVEHTTDESVYGKLGSMQREVDSAYAARAKAWDELQSAGFKTYEDASGKMQFDQKAIASYLKNIDRVQGDRMFEALDAWQAANGRYAETLDKHFAGQSLGADARALNERLGTMRKEIGARAEVFSASKRLRAAAVAQYGVGANGGVFAGMMMGGPVGGLMGEAIFNPGRAALMRAKLSALTDKVKLHIDARVGNLVSGGKNLVPDLPVRSRMIAKGTLDMLQARTPEERRAAYDKRVDELTHLSDPTNFGDHVSTQLVGLSEHVPAHADAMSQIAANAMGVLRQSMPSALPGTTGDGGAFDAIYAKPRPHDRDILRFAQIDHAVQAPVDAITEAAERGHVPDHVLRAVEQTYPDVLRAIQTSILNHAGNGKVRPSHAKMTVFNKILGGSGMTSTKFTQMQSVHRMTPAGGAHSSGSPKVKSTRSAGLLTNTDKLDNIYSK